MTTVRHHPLTDERRRRALSAAGLEGAGPVVEVEPLGGEWAPVTRLRLAGREEAVVVKTRRADASGWGGPHHLRREAVALSLLDGTDVPAPRVLGFDDAAGVLVTTDLGTGPTLEEVLLGTDPVAARAGCIALATAAGRLHAASADREDEHRTRLATLGTDARRDRLGLWPGVTRWPDVVAAAAALGFPDARRAADDVAQVAAELHDPGPWTALIHLDLGPHNVVVTAPDGVALVDFEGSTFGHAGWDAVFLRYPFPNYSAHYGVVPPDVVDAALAAYRTALAEATPEVLDDAAFDRMLAVAAGGMLAVRVLRLPVLAEADQSPHDSWRRRVQLAQQITVFVDLARRAAVLPRLADWFDALGDAMRARWPDAADPPAPTFPAFGATA